MKRRTSAEVEQDVHALRSMDAKALRVRWREVLKIDPPLKMQSGFLRLAIAYRLQELGHGGLSPDALRQLRKYAKVIDDRQSKAGLPPARVLSFDAAASLSPGTRLMREWNGTTELVEVVEGGFIWRGKLYRTLSATAVAITGTKWSGPKFFGLLQPMAARSKRASKSKLLPLAQSLGEAA
jgi:DUF2924 family protein